MVAKALWPALDTLGEDLLLLLPRDRRGSISEKIDLRYGLMGSELVRLVADGHVDIVNGRIAQLDVPPPADPNLATALESVSGNPKPSRWVRKSRAGIVDDYKRQLEVKDVLRSERRKWLGLITIASWFVIDEQRSAAVRQRLDEITTGNEAIGIEDFALAGLAYGIELAGDLYPGRAGKEQRKLLKQIALTGTPGPIWRRQPTMSTAVAASVDPARAAAVEAAVTAAINAATAARNSRSSDGSIGAF